MREIVGACLNGDIDASIAHPYSGIQGFSRRRVHDVKLTSNRTADQRRTLYGIRLDQRGPARVP